MAFASGTSSFKSMWDGFMQESRFMLRDVSFWIDGLSRGEKTLLLGVAFLAVMFLVVRRPGDVKEGGGMLRQFTWAAVIAVFVGMGVGVLFDGRFVIPTFEH